MSDLKVGSLTYTASIDSGGWIKGLDEGLKKFDDFDRQIQSKIQSIAIPSPKLDDAGMNQKQEALTSSAEEIRSAFAPIASSLKQALSGSTAPLHAFAMTFFRQFQEVGATVEKLSVRIDDAMRFPVFLQRVEAFRKGFLSRFQSISEEVPKQLDKAVSHEADASKLVEPFVKARKRIMEAVKPIPGDVGYALEAAVHVDAKASFATYLAGLDQVKSDAIEKMKAMADAVANATGKGSRTGRKQAKGRAENLHQTIASVPPRDNTTKATTVKTTVWEKLGSAIKLAGDIEEKTQAKLAQLIARDARDIDRLIGLWLGFKKVTSVVSTFGSVANATFGKLAMAKLPKLSFDPRQSVVLKGIGSAADGASNSFKNMGQQLLMALGVFGLVFKAVEFIKDGVVAAAGLNETLNKTDAVLGTASAGVKNFADGLGKQFGFVKKDTLDVASGFGGLFKGLGGQSGAALEKSTKDFTMLAADLSSFANMSLQESGEALRTALSGNESDKLKQLGVVTDEATVKNYAYTHGIAALGSELTNQQKIMARAGVIAEGLKDAQGDLEKTSGSTANQFRKLTGNITNLGVQIGSALMPAVDSALSVFNKLGEWALSGFAMAGDSFTGFIDKIKTGFDYVQAAIENPKAAFEVFRLVALQALANIGDYLETFGPNVALVAEYIKKNWLLLIGDAFDWTINAIDKLLGNFSKLGVAIVNFLADPTKGFHVDFDRLSKDFKATADKFPELIKPALTDMSKQILDATKPLTAAVEAKAAKARADAEAAAKAAQARANINGGGAEKAQESDLQKFAKNLTKSTRTPLEVFREEVKKIEESLSGKLIDAETAKRGIEKARKELEGDGPKLSGALEVNSSEARSAILAAMGRTSKSDDPVADNTRAANGLLGQLVGLSRDTLRNTGQTRVVSIP
jgi:hypothetical protein